VSIRQKLSDASCAKMRFIQSTYKFQYYCRRWSSVTIIFRN